MMLSKRINLFSHNSWRLWPTCVLPNAHMAYQFKVEPNTYYPDRREEMLKAANKMQMQMQNTITNQLVADKTAEQNLTRDHYYKVLGVSKHASTQEIKLAYYALAKLFHPDANNSDSQNKRFQEISNAYAILTDDNKRLEYDQKELAADESNMLKKFMKLRAKPSMQAQNNKNSMACAQTPEVLMHMTNSNLRLEITFLEAAHGCKKTLSLSYLNKCPVCNGRAPKLVTHNKMDLCPKCQGTGKVTKRTQTFTSVTTCEACGGRRFMARHQCAHCENRGMVVQQTDVTVVVPAGARDDDIISLENPHTKQRVNYRISVQESDLFKRKGNDVHTEQYISICNAVLGGTVQVRGVYENLTVNVCPGTESHTAVRIAGKGIKTRDACGDHVVTLKIAVPKQLSMKQRQILQAFAKTENTTDD